MNEDIMAKLKEPFDPLEIEWRVGVTNADKTKGLALAYVTNRAIQNRLDSVFGCFGWKNEFREWRGNSQLCGISVLHDGQWINKWDGADDSNMEATKGGLSDAMKRAAYQWGIGRYLYELPDTWMPLEMRGKTAVIKGIPNLPKWALPAGHKESAPDTIQKTQQLEEKKQTSQPDVLTAEQRNTIGETCKQHQVTVERLRDILNLLGHDGKKLGEIPSSEYTRIIDQITGDGLPFTI